MGGAGRPDIIASLASKMCLYNERMLLNSPATYMGKGRPAPSWAAMLRLDGTHSNHGVRPGCRILCHIRWVVAVIAVYFEWHFTPASAVFSLSRCRVADFPCVWSFCAQRRDMGARAPGTYIRLVSPEKSPIVDP